MWAGENTYINGMEILPSVSSILNKIQVTFDKGSQG